MLITAGDLIEANSLQYKITDKEYREYDCLYMKSVLECSGLATIVTASNFKGNYLITYNRFKCNTFS